MSTERLFELSLSRPIQKASRPPCQFGCPAGGDIRGWIGAIALRHKLGWSVEEALDNAWRLLVERNPFPATTGRICPHPCELHCNRGEHDGAVSINALERFVGDWGLRRNLKLSVTNDGAQGESIGVVGAGPAGLSFSYQMARRGYPVTIYDAHSRAGGMLAWGIPEYRLPRTILNAEVQRILDLGVTVEPGVAVGRDVEIAELRRRHAMLFVAIGAQHERRMGIPGEEGPGVQGALEYLSAASQHRAAPLGGNVVVVGGGNTAVDAARTARRAGASVTMLYRRSRSEMPAFPHEIDDALSEGVGLTELVSPIEVLREEDGALRGLRLQRMRLGEPDGSGRRRPEPVPGAEGVLEVDDVLVAVSQEPDWTGLEDERRAADVASVGGDALGPGIASRAIGHGSEAAERVHARLRGLDEPKAGNVASVIDAGRVRADVHPAAPRHETPRRRDPDPVNHPFDECTLTLKEAEALAEATRCLSCGECFGCGRCAMYCNASGYQAVSAPGHGHFYELNAALCEGCGKCMELCPCGFLQEWRS